jgi:hypothetical protein
MGLFGKIKDLLFDEEEVEEKEEKPTETIKMIEREKPIQTEYKPPVVERPVRHEEPITEPISRTMPEKEDSRVENAFPFPDFDEDEFEHVRPVAKPKTTNVLDFERNRRKEKKIDYGRIEKTEVVEKKKFKPSPIISPVYGILNEDYVADDITNRGDPIPEKKTLTVESVRNKAFGSLDEKEEQPKKEVYQEAETVKSYEPIEEKQQKVKTIDELLEDTSDVTISLDEEEVIEPVEEVVTKEEPTEELPKVKKEEVDDTMENDLFDLIDSMYDKGEDGE